jgi:hypothetical protein
MSWTSTCLGLPVAKWYLRCQRWCLLSCPSTSICKGFQQRRVRSDLETNDRDSTFVSACWSCPLAVDGSASEMASRFVNGWLDIERYVDSCRLRPAQPQPRQLNKIQKPSHDPVSISYHNSNSRSIKQTIPSPFTRGFRAAAALKCCHTIFGHTAPREL